MFSLTGEAGVSFQIIGEGKTSLRKVIMKRWIAVGVLSAVALTSVVPVVEAGQREWATAGKVLTGVVAGSLLVRAFEPAPVYQVAPQVVYQQPVVVAPAPQVVYAQPAPVQVQTVYVSPAPVYYYAAPPVVYVPAPVCYAPRVVVGFGFGRGYGHYHHHR